jgi:hypothetical protein
MERTCCNREFDCQSNRYVNPAYAHLYPDATQDEHGDAAVAPERGSFLMRFKNVLAEAMHEAGLRYAESSQVL